MYGDIADHVGREIKIDVLGQTWVVSRQSRKLRRLFVQEARKVLPDPVELAGKQVDRLAVKELDIGARMDAMSRRTGQASEAERIKLQADLERANSELVANRRAQDRWVKEGLDQGTGYLSFSSTAMQSFLFSDEGGALMLYLLLQAHHPNVTEDVAAEILDAMSLEDARRIFAETDGTPPPLEKNGPAPAASS